MALSWGEVSKSEGYQALPDTEKAQAQAQYFDEVVAPQIDQPEEIETARTQFFTEFPVATQRSEEAPGAPISEPEVEEPGVLEKISDFFTGSLRETKATENLPSVLESGMFSDLDKVGLGKIAVGYASGASDDQLLDIVKSVDPSVGIAYDEKGNIIVNRGGRLGILNPPGIDAQDIGGFLGSSALYVSPQGKAATLGSAVLKEVVASGASELARQGIIASTGGEADLESVAMAGLIGGGQVKLGQKAKEVITKIKGQVLEEAVDAGKVAAAKDPATGDEVVEKNSRGH